MAEVPNVSNFSKREERKNMTENQNVGLMRILISVKERTDQIAKRFGIAINPSVRRLDSRGSSFELTIPEAPQLSCCMPTVFTGPADKICDQVIPHLDSLLL